MTNLWYIIINTSISVIGLVTATNMFYYSIQVLMLEMHIKLKETNGTDLRLRILIIYLIQIFCFTNQKVVFTMFRSTKSFSL